MNAAACDFPDDLLESYAMGKLSGHEIEPVEEHLLLCPACQERCARLDDFIEVIKTALAAMSPSPPETLTVRIPIQKPKRRVSHCVAR